MHGIALDGIYGSSLHTDSLINVHVLRFLNFLHSLINTYMF